MIILFTEIFYTSENALPALRLIFPNAVPSVFPLQPHLLSLPPPLPLQTGHCARSPPALLSRKGLPALPYSQTFCKDDSDRFESSSSLRTVLVCLGPTIRYQLGCCTWSSSSCCLPFPTPHHTAALLFTQMIQTLLPSLISSAALLTHY